MTTHGTLVADQFGARARAYVESAVHANGQDLEAIDRLARAAKPGHALDLGCGGGHAAYVLARHAARVTAADLSSEMLAQVEAVAREKGLSNLSTRQAAAERLPFHDGAFDFLTCRFSTHHWGDFERGLREARRALRAGAPAVFIDAVAPRAAVLDTHLQAVELLRDASHARDYSAAQWLAALERSGFDARAVVPFRLRMEWNSWVARTRTPTANQRAIRLVQEAAAQEVKRHFAIEPDGSFTLDAVMIETAAS